MFNQIVTSALWQTVGVLIAIIATAISIIFAIHKVPRLSKKPKTKTLLDIITVSLTVLLIGGTSYVSYILSTSSPPVTTKSPSIQGTIAISTTTPSPTPSTTATLISTPTPPAPTLSPTTISAPTTSLSAPSYSDPQPVCDKKGGQWNLQGIGSIDCEAQAGRTPLIVNDSTWGYLYFNLPNNETFSSNNEISISGGNLLTAAGGGASECVGLAELGKNAGILGVYCGNGTWSIYSTSNTGVIIRQLAGANIITSQSVQMVLDMNATALSFSVDADGNIPHNLKIPLIKPVQVAVVASHTYITGGVSIQNFTYTDHSS